MLTAYKLALSVSMLVISVCVPVIGQAVNIMPGGKGLELTLRSSELPTRITLSDKEAHGFWTENVDRSSGSKGSKDSIPKVDFLARLVDGKTELKVSVFTAAPIRTPENLIATYVIAEGQTVTISELAKFGFVPPKATMVTIDAALADGPRIHNQTRSLQPVLAIDAVPFPMFVLNVRNISAKPVIGFTIRRVKAGRTEGTSVMQGDFGATLLQPGATKERPIIIPAGEARGGDLVFGILAVFFNDGTYEGDTTAAASFLMTEYSRKETLDRLLEVLNATVARFPARVDPKKVISAIRADKDPVNDAVLIRLKTEFPNESTVEAEFPRRSKSAQDLIRNQAIAALTNLEKAAVGRSDEDVNRAFAGLVKHYQDWADRLPK